jgi:hypothetical protein
VEIDLNENTAKRGDEKLGMILVLVCTSALQLRNYWVEPTLTSLRLNFDQVSSYLASKPAYTEQPTFTWLCVHCQNIVSLFLFNESTLKTDF